MTAKTNRPLDELVDLTPAMDAPTIVCRGMIYETLRARGESDFIAASFTFGAKIATRCGAQITIDQLNAFYDHGPAGIAAA